MSRHPTRLCFKCKQEFSRQTGKLCLACAREYLRTRRRLAREEGRCSVCAFHPCMLGRARCEKCYRQQKAACAKYANTHVREHLPRKKPTAQKQARVERTARTRTPTFAEFLRYHPEDDAETEHEA